MELESIDFGVPNFVLLLCIIAKLENEPHFLKSKICYLSNVRYIHELCKHGAHFLKKSWSPIKKLIFSHGHQISSLF